jgi:hypothetical protein
MVMAPVPVIVLLFVVPGRIRVIPLMLAFQVASVGMVFAFIPIMVVMMARIVDPDLNAGFLWRCGAHDESTCREDSRQE